MNKKKENPFEVYTDIYKTWEGIFTSWSKSMPSTPFYRTEMDTWFRPFQNYFGDWTRIYEGFGKTMTGFPLPYESMNEYSRAMMQGINSYVKIYDTWTRSMDKIGRKEFELVQSISRGKKVNVSEIFDIINESYSEITDTLLNSLKGTPLQDVFKGSEQINKALKQFMDSFSDEQKQAKESFEIFSNYYIKAINSGTALIMDSSRSFSDMLAKGEMSTEAYNAVINTYGEAFKESAEALLGPLSSLFPEYKDMIDDLTGWTNRYFNLLSSWFEIPLKILQGIGKSSHEISKFTDEAFLKDEMRSPEEFYNVWSEFYKKASSDLTDNIELSVTLPKFLNSLTEYIRATNNVYERSMTPTFPSKESMDEVYAKVKEMSSLSGKKGERTQKTTEPKQPEKA